MKVINEEELRAIVVRRYHQAKSTLESALRKSAILEQMDIVSNNIPNYDINELQFGAYKKDYFVSFFADMRQSTSRANDIGPEKTFLTIHAVMPAMIYVVEQLCGSIVDIPGDGVMALFKNNTKNIYLKDKRDVLNAESLAVLCGQELLNAINRIVNPLLRGENIRPVSFGVGIDSGDVIVTKIGTNKTIDIKAIGNAINNSSKKSSGDGEINISKSTYSKMPFSLKCCFSESSEFGWYSQKIEG